MDGHEPQKIEHVEEIQLWGMKNGMFSFRHNESEDLCQTMAEVSADNGIDGSSERRGLPMLFSLLSSKQLMFQFLLFYSLFLYTSCSLDFNTHTNMHIPTYKYKTFDA